MNASAVGATLIILVALVPLRLHLVPPIIFFEGDDAALCTGIARISTDADIGPYYFHPRPVPIANPARGVAWFVGQREPSRQRFYRYDTMPGMYFLGYVTRGVAAPATRMAWICFLAGTVSPLLFALFLVRFFEPSTPLALPLCYTAIATSPEQWVSGSAYINDKIVASACLAGALYLLTRSADRPRRLRWLVGAGVLLGLATLMRFDTVLLVPATIGVLWVTRRSRRDALYAGAALLATATIVYVAVCTYMHAPPPSGAVDATKIVSLVNAPGSWWILVSAFGPIRMVVFIAGVAALVAAIAYLGRNAPDDGRLASLRVVRTKTAVALLFVLPEVAMLAALPFKSQKYVLIASSVIAGLCALIPIALCETLVTRRVTARRSVASVAVLIATLIALDGSVRLGMIKGVDGLRAIGGHLITPLRERRNSKAARSLFTRASDPHRAIRGEIVMHHPRWLLEESTAYHALVNGWHNTLVPSSVVVDGSSYQTVNRYVDPSTGTMAIVVPSDSSRLALDALLPIARAYGRPVYVMRRYGLVPRPIATDRAASP